MAKKQKQPSYSITFDGFDIAITNAKLVITGSSEPHLHIEKKGNQWLILTTEDYLMNKDGETVITIDRSDSSASKLSLDDGQSLDIWTLVKLRVLPHHQYYCIDKTPEGLRIAFSSGLTKFAHVRLKRIVITKE